MELIRNLKENLLVKNLFLAFLATVILAISSKIKISEESYDVAWIPIQKVLTLNSELSIERMLKKTLKLKKQQNI